VILPYLLSHCQCKGNLSAILLRAMQIAHKHESALDARQRREPFIDAL
jgi:3-methyladenine DNA glycosylase Mpg